MAFPGIRLAITAAALVFPVCGNAAGNALSRPILGYSAQVSPPELRAIFGVPGSAVFSDPMSLPAGTTRLRLAPAQQYLIIERADETPGALLLNGTETGELVTIPGVVRAPDFISFSPAGHSAALISLAYGRLQIIAGLPQSPRVVKDIDLHTLPELPRVAAVSDDASTVLFSSTGAVFLMLPDGAAAIVVSVTATASIAFLPASTAAAIGDPGTGALYLFRRVAGEAGVAPSLASGLLGLGQIAASSDGRVLYVTDPQEHSIWCVNVSSGTVRQLDSQVSASKLERLRNADTFLISAEPGLPAWVFFRQGEAAGAVFVPAAPSTKRGRAPPDRDRAVPVGSPGDAATAAAITGNAVTGLSITTTSLPNGSLYAA